MLHTLQYRAVCSLHAIETSTQRVLVRRCLCICIILEIFRRRESQTPPHTPPPPPPSTKRRPMYVGYKPGIDGKQSCRNYWQCVNRSWSKYLYVVINTSIDSELSFCKHMGCIRGKDHIFYASLAPWKETLFKHCITNLYRITSCWNWFCMLFQTLVMGRFIIKT